MGANVSLGRSVQESRAPELVDADDPQTALYRKLEFFPTPPWAVRAGAALIKRLDILATSAWEPACGQGHMAEPLREYFAEVWASDIHAYGYGEVLDFLLDQGPPRADWIITNPPFAKAEEFARHGMTRAHRGVAILARLSWLESVDRYDLFYHAPWPLTVVAPYAERVPMTLGKWSPNASTATAYAWFIFQNEKERYSPRLKHIPPGQRALHAKPEDVRRFVTPSSTPLFDGR